MTLEQAEKVGIAISYIINKILNVPGINLQYEED